MKMQEVITQLRELAPAAAENTEFAESLMCDLVGVMEDMQNATTLTAVKAIAAEAFKQSLVVQQHIVHATKAAKALQDLNKSYKEKLGPRGPKKPKDCPGQQILPGIGDEGGTPTEVAVGETSTGETSTTGGGTPTTWGRTPSFMRSGRHG